MTAEELRKSIIEQSPVARAYEEYNKKIGGAPIGEGIGYPDFQIEERFGGFVGLYHECIKQGKTWEELLGFVETTNPDIEI
jgi:hypothetical protein